MEKLCSVELNKTFEHKITNYKFDDLSEEICIEIFKDGRVFSHFIENWLETHYQLKHIKGCKSFDFIDKNNSNIFYDEKTFTKLGCKFCPSNMIGQGRKFDKEIFEKKTKKLIFCIVSNIDFPNIKVKFIKGEDLIKDYPNGKISFKNHIKFFN